MTLRSGFSFSSFCSIYTFTHAHTLAFLFEWEEQKSSSRNIIGSYVRSGPYCEYLTLYACLLKVDSLYNFCDNICHEYFNVSSFFSPFFFLFLFFSSFFSFFLKQTKTTNTVWRESNQSGFATGANMVCYRQCVGEGVCYTFYYSIYIIYSYI